ncbi:MAG: 6-carboxytetrahydropterin synthase QueD [Eubacterium sp.]|nr:6-carboxytetrahydropterin synthase QueD [Eubacterium sp.]
MYILRTRSEFDSAHFLKGYEGKCANIHGHRWIVTIEVGSETLEEEGPSRGMVVDFSKLKEDLKEETSKFDHVLIIEKGSLSEPLLGSMRNEGFMIQEMDFRPTAENFAKYFYDVMSAKGYSVIRTRVFETPENCAEYTK